MKKLAILLLAFVLLCSCFMLAACGDGDDSSSAADSSAAGTASTDGTSSAAAESKEASSEASVEASSEASVEESSETPDESADASEDTSSDEPVAAEGKLLWLTHYNTLSNEGSGVVMSTEYTGGEWWFHCAFAPVEGEDGVYEIVEVIDGSTDGSGHFLAIPEGGFVYALHTGNNYEGGIDYTTQTSGDVLNDARTWKVGEKFTFTGIDFENFTDVPTETPDLQWYEDGDNGTGHYVCTATYTKVG